MVARFVRSTPLVANLGSRVDLVWPDGNAFIAPGHRAQNPATSYTPLREPSHEYAHGDGASVTGGYSFGVDAEGELFVIN